MLKKNHPLIMVLLLVLSSPLFAGHYTTSSKRMVPLALECRMPGMVALTFDDGPSDNYGTVLATLDNHDVTATFFVVGSKLENQKHIDSALDAVAAGHQIENHSWDHTNFLSLSISEITDQTDRTNQIMWDTLGVTPRFLRPPYGRIDIPTAMPIWDLNIGVALWNLDPRDYELSSQNVIQNINTALNSASSDNDSFIILLHDFSAASVDGLDDIILTIKNHGYTFVSLDECVDSGSH